MLGNLPNGISRFAFHMDYPDCDDHAGIDPSSPFFAHSKVSFPYSDVVRPEVVLHGRYPEEDGSMLGPLQVLDSTLLLPTGRPN